ncbi:MAG TPA: hypothetical protein VJ717_04325 [Gemmatimonadaceae bacterium]|nr:hypothetical protein [Gemmatimonadaceae bacterium]
MIKGLSRATSFGLGVAALGVLLPLGAAQAQALPAAKDLIAKYVEAVGGVEAFKKYKSVRVKAALDIPAQGMSGTLTILSRLPNETMMKIEIPGIGEMKQGSNGEVAWFSNPMQGSRVITGKEAEAMTEGPDPLNYLRLSSNIASSETVEKATFDGKECYKVKHTYKSGRTSFDCFSPTDGLIIATVAKQSTPMGDVEQTTILSAYKDFNGMKRPTTMVIEAQGFQQVLTISEVTFDDVQESEMVLPPDIQAQLPKKP